MFELSVRSDIASAHLIKGHEGKCKNLHGHMWKIEVTVESAQLNDLGMVCDFAVLKKRLQEVLDPLDHGCLNDVPYFKDANPTTENIAKYVYDAMTEKVKPLNVKQVCAWESDTSKVVYSE